MILLVSGGTSTVRPLLGHPNLGVLITPRDGNALPEKGVPWACDNSAFSDFNPDQFRRMLKRVAGRLDCLFVACPDVVADHSATRQLWDEWVGIIREAGQRPAFVLQDGATSREIPDTDVLFVGGSTSWKLGREAALMIQGFSGWVHMGRVNTEQRLVYAHGVGVDSVDGSQFSRWSRTHLPWALSVLDRLDRQQRLF